MMRNMLLKVLAPAALAIGGIPAIASAHGHAFVRFSVGCGPCYYPSAYYAPTYCPPAYVAPAPVVVCAPAVTYAPAPVVVAPQVVYTAPPVVVAPAPVVVYSTGYCYPRPFFYSHVHYYRR